MGRFYVDEGFPRNRKVLAAGRDAALLYFGLLAVHQTHGEDGVIPANRADETTLLLEMPALGFTPDELSEQLDRCERAELIERDPEGSIRIRGYDDEWCKRCTTCRKGLVRNPRVSTCDACLERRRRKSADFRGRQQCTPTPTPTPTPQGSAAVRGPAGCADAGPEGGGLTPAEIAEVDALVDLARSLGASARSERKGREVLAAFRRAGGTADELRALVRLGSARTKAKDGNPFGLLSRWLPDPHQWRGVLDDETERSTTRTARRAAPAGDDRPTPEPMPVGDLIAGAFPTYGEEPNGNPDQPQPQHED